MTVRHFSLMRLESIIFLLDHIDEYVGKQSLLCAAGRGRSKLVQLLLGDNLTLAIEISNVYIC